MTALDDSLTLALRSAPELQTAPSVALGIAQDASQTGSDPTQNAQVVAQVNNQQAQQQAVQNVAQKVGHPSLVGRALSWLNNAADTVNNLPGVSQIEDVAKKTADVTMSGFNALGAGLREVQHQYRAVHDIEARNGPIAGLLAGLGIGAGAALGSLVEPGEGTVIGGELAGAAVTRLAPGGSFQRTTSGANYQGTYNRQTGQYEGPKGNVSIGQDVAGALGLKYGSAPENVASGITDFIADLTLDPLAVAGKGYAAAKSAEGLSGMLGTTFSHAAQGDTLALRAQDLEQRVANLPSVNRAFEELAASSDQDIIKNWPKLSPLANKLGAASTKDEVVDVFRNALMQNEMTQEVVPSMSLTRLPFAVVSRAIQDHGGLGADAIRSMTSLLPTYFDPKTLDLSGKAFNLGDPNAVQGVYRFARFAQSRDVAAGLAADFAASMDDPGKQMTIWKNIVQQTLAAKGLPEDSQFITDALNETAQQAFGGGEAVYGVGQNGRNLSKVVTDQGDKSLGLLESQTGKVLFPNFDQITREVRSLNNAKNWYGAADEWMYQHFTQGIFKRLVLLSGGFAQRIAMAETIPASLREGVKNLVQSRLAASAAEGMTDEELSGISAVTTKVMGGVNSVLGDADKTEFVANMIADNGGHTVAPAIDTTTPSATVSPVERASRNLHNAYSQIPKKFKLGDDFGVFGSESGQYMDAWQRWLGQISNDPASQKAAQAYLDVMRSGGTAEDATTAGWQAAKEHWDNQPAEVLAQYGRHFAQPADGMDPHEAWGRAIMENVKGATHANPDVGGFPHVPLLSNIANGEITPMDALSNIDAGERPLHVMGRQLLPDTTGTIERIANVGFKKVLDPVINYISREPLYVNEAYRQYQYLKPLVESGDMLAEDARQLAQVRAVNGVLPFIHNTLERSQFSQLARNFMPFYFAQEQSYKRFGRLLADDPGAFRRFQLMISGLHEVGSTQQDPNGKSWLVYPGAGFLSNGAVKLADGIGVPIVGSVPTSFSGQLKSLNTIFPFAEGVRPGFGPVVAIPAHLVENLFPETTPAIHTLIGDQAASGSIYDQLIPNQTVKSVVQALDPGVRSRSMQNAMNNTLQYIDYQNRKMQDEWVKQGKDPGDPNMPHVPGSLPTDSAMDRQSFLSRIKNQTRVTFLFKSLLGAVSPTAPVTNVGDWGLRQEWRDLIAQKGIVAAHDEFLTRHPDATAFTVFASDSQAGAPIPANVKGQNWINDNLDYLRRYPNAAAWFVPQFAGGQFSQGVYNEQMAEHLREHKSLDQMQKDMWIAAGNDQFYSQDLPAYKKAVADAQATGDKQQVSFIRQDFNNYLTKTLGPQNPVWWDDLNSADRDHNRQLAVQQMRDMFAKGDVPDSPMTQDLGSLMQDYETYAQAKIDAKTDPTITVSQLKTDWQAYVDKLATDKPTLAPVIRSVFRQL